MAKDKSNIGRKNSFWNMHLTAILSLSMVLFLVGLVGLLFFVARDVSKAMRENMVMSIILADSADMAYEQRIERFLIGTDYAKELVYISKEDALKEHIASLGDDPSEFLGFNPLSASIEVKLNSQYANADSVLMIEGKLKRFDLVERVAYQKDVLDLVNANITRISFVIGILALILLFVSVALMNSTIRLMIYADRFLIRSMRLVGAMPWFIRWPYIRRNMFDGFIASLLAIVYLGVFVYYLQYGFSIDVFLTQPLTLVMVAGIVIILGVLLTAILAFFAVGRYLKMKSDKMYLI